MNLETYVSFLNKIGPKVIWANGVPFYSYRKGFLWSVPQFASYNLEPRNLRAFLWTKVLGIIFTSKEFGQKETNFWVCGGNDYDYERLQRRTATKTRRGLEKCEIRNLDWEQLRVQGLEMNIDSLKRQGRKSGRLDNKRWWDRFCRVSSHFDDIKAWGAFVRGELANYIYVIIHDDILFDEKHVRVGSVVHTMSYSHLIKGNSEHGNFYPNEALLYFVTKKLLEDEKCAYVIHGVKSDNRGLRSWKHHMGYELKPIFHAVVANPLLHLIKPLSPQLKRLL